MDTYRVQAGHTNRIDPLTGGTQSTPALRTASNQRQPPHSQVFVVPAAGLHFLGEYRDSGFEQPRYLVRRGDGQVLQLTRLLYLVVASLCPATGIEEVAARVSVELGRKVSAENVEYLLANNLLPLGVVSTTDESGAVSGPETVLPRSELVLGLKADRVLLRARVVAVLAKGLALLHRPAVVVAVLAAFAVFDLWLFLVHGAITPLLSVLTEPEAVLASLGLSLVAMLFHELGHASACKYSGAVPGPIGVGIYLIWPAAYTDVTDVYRVGRAGRLRTDFGGVYFNAVFILGMAALYRATDAELFLAVALVSHLDIIRQLIPIFRLDGYYILGDVVGVPDLFGKMRPVLLGLLPGRRTESQVTGLRRGPRIVITVWVLSAMTIFGTYLSYLVWHLPQLIPAVADAVGMRWAAARTALASYDFAEAAVAGVRLVLLLLPVVGLVYLLSRPVSKLVRYLAARTGRGRSRKRGSSVSSWSSR